MYTNIEYIHICTQTLYTYTNIYIYTYTSMYTNIRKYTQIYINIHIYNTKVARGFDQFSEENLFFCTVKHSQFSSFEVNKFSQLPVNGYQRFVFFICTGRLDKISGRSVLSEPELAFRSIRLCCMAATCWPMRPSACLISYQNEKPEGAWFHCGL